MTQRGDDRVGWGAVDPEFWIAYREKARRVSNLLQRLRELPTGDEHTAARVRVWQSIDELEVLPRDHAFYVIAWELARIAAERQGRLYETEYAPRFRAIYEAHGIDYDDLEALEEWEEVPEELDSLSDELGRHEDRIREEVYREFGETEMADLWRNDRATYQERWDRGQDMVHPGLRERLDQMIRGEIEPEDVFGRGSHE